MSLYSIGAITNVFNISIGSLYYVPRPAKDESDLVNKITKIFNGNYRSYGTRRIQKSLESSKYNIFVSRWKIGKIMQNNSLISEYVKNRKKKPPNRSTTSDANPVNILNQEFHNRATREVVLSDLLYFRITKWCYICVLLDVSRRIVIGQSVGSKKDAELVKQAFYSVKGDLRRIKLLHTDQGSEFLNKTITGFLKAFGISHSLSKKGHPFDNSPMEAFYKTLRVEFLNNEKFNCMESFRIKFKEWIDWYNYERLHSSLDYETPLKKENTNA